MRSFLKDTKYYILLYMIRDENMTLDITVEKGWIYLNSQLMTYKGNTFSIVTSFKRLKHRFICVFTPPAKSRVEATHDC